MAIEIRRVGGKWPRRYIATVTPPNGDWESERPQSRRAIWRRLSKDNTHPADGWPAFNHADAVWKEGR